MMTSRGPWLKPLFMAVPGFTRLRPGASTGCGSSVRDCVGGASTGVSSSVNRRDVA